MKRKRPILSCESESGDEDSPGPLIAKRQHRISKDVPEEREAPKDTPSEKPAPDSPVRESKREFAWMDSGDESNADEGDGGGSDDEKASSHHSPVVALPESVRQVETFSEFLRVTPALKKIVPSMPADELTALCETASRLKHFDGDLFAEAFKQISVRIKAGEFDIPSITAVATALVDLNACDASVFRAATDVLIRRVHELPKDQRLHWLKLLASSGHAPDQVIRNAALISALKAPLPEDNAPAVRYCYEWVGQGFCPRGTRCTYAHPERKK
eukprot:TRINITY_DN55784_c0_g1_i1.p1 TRINITY_DN55784_c0_g1~~TRINITY_DN55784_c0_g1_i1.p1  ORF type:complete len:272 (+),score=43.16 TRINITY_DN55784_c0_g1_i1:54-869(+)